MADEGSFPVEIKIQIFRYFHDLCPLSANEVPIVVKTVRTIDTKK